MTLDKLSNAIVVRLCPGAPTVTKDQITQAITTIAERVDYGLLEATKDSNHIWRWEVNDTDMLNEPVRAEVLQRREKRKSVRETVNRIISTLSEESRALFNSNRRKSTINSVKKV